MRIDDAALELARAVGWVGGALYLVDQVGGRLQRWRLDREFMRQWQRDRERSIFPGTGTPPRICTCLSPITINPGCPKHSPQHVELEP